MDAGLNKGFSNAGIAANFSETGGTLDPDVIARHKREHWVKPVDPDAPKATKRDLAITLRDKVLDAVEPMSGEALLLMGKELAPMVNAGMKAQITLDKREVAAKKNTQADILLSLLRALRGEGTPTPLLLDDGKTVEGTFVALD